ncbi:MAG TPA: hypothetical protein VMR41_06325 [Patescibacteria group bacterium]|nr:hypothetical protein [Patescibacteria group bacterium]
MLLNFLFQDIAGAVHTVFSIWPHATVAGIPYIGSQISATLYTAVEYWNTFTQTTFPYGQLPWTIFLYVILPFEFSMLVLKFILGSRTPAHLK